MNNSRAVVSGRGKGRSGRRESIAAFASNARRSNGNLVSSEGIAYCPRQFVPGVFIQLRPVVSLRWQTLLDDDVDALVVRKAIEWLRKLQYSFFGEVFSFDGLAHSGPYFIDATGVIAFSNFPSSSSTFFSSIVCDCDADVIARIVVAPGPSCAKAVQRPSR